MLDPKDLQAIAQLMDNLEKRMDSKIDGLEKRMDSKLEKQRDDILEVIQQQAETTQTMIHDSEERMKIYMENQVCKRIDSLFDGYKLAHEKQWELEHETEKLKQQMNDLQARLTALEKKISA